MSLSKKKVLAISGSTRVDSTNLQIIEAIQALSEDMLDITIYKQLGGLPHFNPDLDHERPPVEVTALRNSIAKADGVLICTPEYIFSLPGSLKNALEWTVSTTLFADKPVAIITASGLGEKAHESIQLIMQTMGARMDELSQLLIQGARAKVNHHGITEKETLEKIKKLLNSFMGMLQRPREHFQ